MRCLNSFCNLLQLRRPCQRRPVRCVSLQRRREQHVCFMKLLSFFVSCLFLFFFQGNSLQSHNNQLDFFLCISHFSYCLLKSEILRVHLAELPGLNRFQLVIDGHKRSCLQLGPKQEVTKASGSKKKIKNKKNTVEDQTTAEETSTDSTRVFSFPRSSWAFTSTRKNGLHWWKAFFFGFFPLLFPTGSNKTFINCWLCSHLPQGAAAPQKSHLTHR